MASSGGGSLKGLRADSLPGPAGGGGDDDDSTLPASPEMLKMTSEMELLDSAGSLGVVRKFSIGDSGSCLVGKEGVKGRGGGVGGPWA